MVEFSWIIYSLAQWLHTLLNKRGDFDDPWVYCSCIIVSFMGSKRVCGELPASQLFN
jgi:hypothetical protein